MVERDVDEFSALMDDAADMLGRPRLEPRQLGLHFAALAEHSLPMVRAALLAHMRDPQRGRFVPTPADVIAQINAIQDRDGRPGNEEAWALCLRGEDEAETIVWTAEMAQAWAVARVVLPDEVGARMAFKEAYARIVAEARRDREPVVWSASIGHDPARRVAAITEAVALKRLPAGELPLSLPAPQRGLTLLQYVGDLAARPDAPSHCRARLLEIRDRLSQQSDAPSLDACERARTEELKALTAARVAAAQAGGAAA